MPGRVCRSLIKCRSFEGDPLPDKVKHNPTSTTRPSCISSPPRRTGVCPIGSFEDYAEGCPSFLILRAIGNARFSPSVS